MASDDCAVLPLRHSKSCSRERFDNVLGGEHIEIVASGGRFYDCRREPAPRKERVGLVSNVRVFGRPSEFRDVILKFRECVVPERSLRELTYTDDQRLARRDAHHVDLVIVVPPLSRFGDRLLRIVRSECATAQVRERLTHEVGEFRFGDGFERPLAEFVVLRTGPINEVKPETEEGVPETVSAPFAPFFPYGDRDVLIDQAQSREAFQILREVIVVDPGRFRDLVGGMLASSATRGMEDTILLSTRGCRYRYGQ